MPNTIAYKKLSVLLADIYSELIKFPIADEFTDANRRLTIAYVLLAHAYIEDYFETLCFDVVVKYQSGSIGKSESDQIETSICYYYHEAYKSSFIDEKYKNSNIPSKRDIINYNIDKYKNYLKPKTFPARSNNGISGKDILKILLPVGYDKLTLLTLAAFDTISRYRNEGAHSGKLDNKKSVTVIHKEITNLVDVDIKQIDADLQSTFGLK